MLNWLSHRSSTVFGKSIICCTSFCCQCKLASVCRKPVFSSGHACVARPWVQYFQAVISITTLFLLEISRYLGFGNKPPPKKKDGHFWRQIWIADTSEPIVTQYISYRFVITCNFCNAMLWVIQYWSCIHQRLYYFVYNQQHWTGCALGRQDGINTGPCRSTLQSKVWVYILESDTPNPKSVFDD